MFPIARWATTEMPSNSTPTFIIATGDWMTVKLTHCMYFQTKKNLINQNRPGKNWITNEVLLSMMVLCNDELSLASLSIIEYGACILEHVSEIKADICSNIVIITLIYHVRYYLTYMF